MKQNATYLYADGVHSRKQLHNLLEAAGFTVSEDTFRNLEMKEDGKYADVTFRMTEGYGLTGLSERDAKESVFDGVFQRLANVLGQRFLSDIEVTDKNPLTEGSQKGIAYVKAHIAGIPMATKEFGGQLFNSYVQGIMTEKDIAARLYYPDMLKMHNELHREALNAASSQKKASTVPADAETTRFIYVQQQAQEHDLLLRITDVRVYRNPQNATSTEFRMRCRIDGEQQMGKVLTAAQVENLANGEDKTRMAAKVFADELSRENSRKQQQGMGL